MAELACCSALLVGAPLLGVSELPRRLELTPALRLALGHFPLRRLPGCGQKGAFERAKLGGVLARPLERLLQSHAAIQKSRVAAEPLPLLRRRAELAPQPQALAVLVEPVAEGRPLADQRLVGDLGRLLVQRDQTGLGQDLQHRADGRFLVGTPRQLGDRRPPAGILRALAQLGQLDEDAPGDRLLRACQTVSEHPLGGLGEGTLDPARRGVAGQRQPAPAPPLPGLQQRVRQQGQRPGLLADVAQQ